MIKTQIQSTNSLIYGLFDPISNELRYVGVTSQILQRRLNKHMSVAKSHISSNHKDNWLRSLLKIGKHPEIFPLQDTNVENCEFDEQWNIAYFKSIGCRLTNSTMGGEGMQSPSLETREKIRAIRKNESIETREKRRKSLLGHVLSNQTKYKISLSRTGKSASEETKIRMSNSHKNHLVSEDSRKKISSGRRKLSNKAIEEIKNLKEKLTESKIAELYNVSKSTISRVQNNVNRLNGKRS